jgi:hypothetical protein
MNKMSPIEMRQDGREVSSCELQLEEEMQQVLSDLRTSVHAWSEAAYHRPRTITSAERRVWRHALGWALGCLLAAGTVSTGVYHYEHKAALNQTALQTAQQHTETALRQDNAQTGAAVVQEQKAGEEDDALMAKVDSDVSRQVPSAMEPLAQLLEEDGNE